MYSYLVEVKKKVLKNEYKKSNFDCQTGLLHSVYNSCATITVNMVSNITPILPTWLTLLYDFIRCILGLVYNNILRIIIE